MSRSSRRLLAAAMRLGRSWSRRSIPWPDARAAVHRAAGAQIGDRSRAGRAHVRCCADDIIRARCFRHRTAVGWAVRPAPGRKECAMSGPVPDRTIAGSGVSWGALRVEAGNTTRRWQDKRPRGAASVGCGFSRSYGPHSRGAEITRTSRQSRFLRDFMRLTRCAGSRP